LLHYEIRKLIGKGGMGEVYLARDTKLDRNVAVKILRTDLSPHVRASERLLREARAVAGLEHPNICHIHEISEADGFSFIVMQYVVGTTLDAILSGRGIDVDTALDIGAQIAEGLAEAHSRGIIHRDIKPANIIISEKMQAKILDFGLAKFIEAESPEDAASRMESTGGVMGTVPYMSPEQLHGRAVDARTDVFSFGSLLFEMLSGTSPFRRERNEDTISAILTEEPDWSFVSPVLRPLLERCLAKNHENRYASAGKWRKRWLRHERRSGRGARLDCGRLMQRERMQRPTNRKSKQLATRCP
jgi:serine/threonine protein kinase